MHADGAADSARHIAEQLLPRSITIIPIESGGMLLCGARAQGAHRDADILAIVDGTGGSPEVVYPLGLIAAPAIPGALLGRLSQDRSYLLLDGARRPRFWTDHVGVSRIYHVRAAGCDVFSDDVETLARLAPEPDHDSLAFFLANGTVALDRTLYAGIRALPVASVVSLTADGPSGARYWHFRPGQEPEGDTAAVKRDMWRHIESCVAAHTAGRQIVLPLSGGYDSTMLLGLIHRWGVPLTAFSYVNGEPQAHSDAAVGQATARSLGVDHHVRRIDGIDTISLLRANLEQGLRVRSCCNEIGAYREAAEHAREHYENPLFMFGDHLFGQRTLRLRTETDMLGGAAVKHPDALLSYTPLVGAERVSTLQCRVAADYSRLLREAPAFEQRDDVKDWLYASVSATWDLLPLRVHAAGKVMAFTTPLYDISMLDFLKHVHFRHRLDKRLYRTVCESNFPALFAGQRSRDRQGLADVAGVLRRDEASIRAVTSTLDGAVPGLAVPGGFDAMLDLALGTVAPAGGALVSRPEAVGLEFFRSLTRLQLMPLHWLQPIKRQFWNTHRILPDPAYMFRRAMHLAMGFQQQAAPIRLPSA